jgi:outer membrane protein, heavy metal efflux system
MPEPQFTYGLYLSRVETRVGPQRHRFSLSQVLPRPGRLAANADAASFDARSAERKFDAMTLAVARRGGVLEGVGHRAHRRRRAR